TSGNPSRFNWTAGRLTVTGTGFKIASGEPLGASLTVGASKALVLSNASETLIVGTTASSSLTVSGAGAADVAGSVIVGQTSQTSSITVSGACSSFSVDQDLTIGQAGSRTFT